MFTTPCVALEVQTAKVFPITHIPVFIPPFIIYYKPNISTLLKIVYAKAAHIFLIRRPCSFSLLRPVFFSYQTALFILFVKTSIFICAHTRWLKLKLQPVKRGSEVNLFIVLTTAASNSNFVIFDVQEIHQSFGGVKKKWNVIFLYLVKVQTEMDICSFHAMCFREIVYNIQFSELFPTMFKCPLKKRSFFM
jgi:hypothetical protein